MDLTPLLAGRGGVARYAAALHRELSGPADGAGGDEAQVEIRAFAVGRGPLGALPPGCRRLAVPLRTVQAAWRATGRPSAGALLGGIDVDLVHSLDLVCPPTARPTVLTIHDTAALDHPSLHPRRAVDQQRLRLRQAAAATVVVANSAATAADAARHGVDPGRIVVTPLGLGPPPPPGPLPSGFPDPDGAVLCVGEVNLRKAVHAAFPLLERLPAADRPLLVVAGSPGNGEVTLERAAADHPGVRWARLPGADDGQLATLYRRAGALLVTSVAEGFCLPVLEAMSHGLPVVSADLPAVREVAGEDAAYLPPGDAGGGAEVLAAVLGGGTAVTRMRTAGPGRAAGFTWTRTAQLTASAYRRALGCA